MRDQSDEKSSGGLRKVGAVALLIVGVADLAVINLVLAPKAFGPEASVAEALSAPPPVAVAVLTATTNGEPSPPDSAPSAAKVEPPFVDAASAPPAASETTKPPALPPVTQWRVHFATAATAVNPTDHATLSGVVEAWKRSGEPTVRVEGHADQRGEHTRNSLLSRKRAESVASLLGSMGIASRKLSIGARGDSEPIDTRQTEEALAANRRVEITFR